MRERFIVSGRKVEQYATSLTLVQRHFSMPVPSPAFSSPLGVLQCIDARQSIRLLVWRDTPIAAS